MVGLNKLCIYWAYKLSKVLVRRIVASLHRLEELVLCEFQDIDTEIATEVVNRLPRLRRFHYASDYMKNLDKMEENLEFLIDFVGNTTSLAPLYTLSKLKGLETFWISDIEDLKQAREIILKMKNLREVSISAFEKKNKDLNPIFSVLSKKTTLISLSLQSNLFLNIRPLVQIGQPGCNNPPQPSPQHSGNKRMPNSLQRHNICSRRHLPQSVTIILDANRQSVRRTYFLTKKAKDTCRSCLLEHQC